MRRIETQHDITWWRWSLHGLGAVILLTMVFGGYLFMLRPLARQQHQAEIEAEQVVRSLSRSAQIVKGHETIVHQLAELQRRANEVKRRIPDQPHEAEFLNDVARLAQQHSIQIRDFRRLNADAGNEYSQVTINLAIEGTYGGLCRFFESLAGMPRVMAIQRLELKAIGEQTVYPVNLTIVLYFGGTSSATAVIDRKPASEVRHGAS